VGEPFLGSEAIAGGKVSKATLRSHYTRIFRDVYVSPGTELTPAARAKAAWLWSRRKGIIAGFSASAVHGARWIDATRPAELIHDNRHRLDGLTVWGDRLEADEVEHIGEVPVTTPSRTALDLASWYPLNTAVAAIDSLARATSLKIADVELLASRYPGRRGIRRARAALELVDAGAESPKETWLRLVLRRAGVPPLQTQIEIYDDHGYLIARADMGWEDIRLAIEYEGDHHRTDRSQFARDINRYELLTKMGWIVVRVTAKDRPADIVRRVKAALACRS
jgi:very-short-patch-repair endonuclease